MKGLNINPRNHEIELWSIKEGSLAFVHFSLGKATGDIHLTAKEAERIGEWFVALAKELSAK